MMKCPRCHSQEYSRNGWHQGKQRYLCKSCGRQWLQFPNPRGYPNAVRQLCLKMYGNGLSIKDIQRYTNISQNTLLNWVRQTEESDQSIDDQADVTEAAAIEST